MPIRRRNPRKKVILAGIQGLIIGIVGVVVFGFLLSLSNEKKPDEENSTPTEQEEQVDKGEGEEKVEVSGEVTLPFKAKQYGLFTTKESAITFMDEQPSLKKAGIVQVQKQFYVWSDLFVDNVSLSEVDSLPSFTKPLFVSTKGCEDPKIKNIMNVLQEEKISKNYFDSIAKKENYPDDMMKIVGTVTAFSDISSVIRLHVFTHYVEQNPCIELNF